MALESASILPVSIEAPWWVSSRYSWPWTAVIRLKRSPEKLFEYACHEGNVEIIRDALAAARVVEKK